MQQHNTRSPYHGTQYPISFPFKSDAKSRNYLPVYQCIRRLNQTQVIKITFLMNSHKFTVPTLHLKTKSNYNRRHIFAELFPIYVQEKSDKKFCGFIFCKNLLWFSLQLRCHIPKFYCKVKRQCFSQKDILEILSIIAFIITFNPLLFI